MEMKEMKRKILIVVLVASLVANIAFIILFVTGTNDTYMRSEWNALPISEETAAGQGNYNPEYMDLAIKNAMDGYANGIGGPIGCVIVKDGEIIVSGSNEIAVTGYGFSHAEMCALQDAEDKLGRDLSGCELYTSAQPCLMCESAISGAGIDVVYYAATLQDMEDYGFNDLEEYEEIHDGKNLVKSIAVDIPDRLEPLEAMAADKKQNGK